MNERLIKNYTLDEAEALFARMGERAFRARQLFNWLYERNVSSFDEMTDFSKSLRSQLNESFSVTAMKPIEKKESGLDGTIKFLFETHDGEYVEAVYLVTETADEDERITICVSSQVGCAMGCGFCNTARIGFRRNLDAAEILDQICHIRRLTGSRNNNVVFMGMGEPFLNYDNVMKSADIMNYSFGFHISVRKITISTCGILPSIKRYIDEDRPYNLAISLNDTISSKRDLSMPVNKKYPIEEIADYLNKNFPVSRSRLTLEYVMRRDNVTRDDARRIKTLFRNTRIKLNLIPLNQGGSQTPEDLPDGKEIESFIKYLEIVNVPVVIRKSLGADIDGACGQLSGKRYCDGETIPNSF
jgi:23S rRNA (adenine2503-C2)-methyltransferase